MVSATTCSCFEWIVSLTLSARTGRSWCQFPCTPLVVSARRRSRTSADRARRDRQQLGAGICAVPQDDAGLVRPERDGGENRFLRARSASVLAGHAKDDHALPCRRVRRHVGAYACQYRRDQGQCESLQFLRSVQCFKRTRSSPCRVSSRASLATRRTTRKTSSRMSGGS